MADATAATSPSRPRPIRKRPPSATARTASISPDQRFVPSSASPATHSGEPTIYVKTAESGARRVQGFCPDVERQSTRPLKETPRNCTPSVRELHVNVLSLSQGADSVSL